MSAPAHPGMRRALRSSASVLVASLALSWATIGIAPEARHATNGYSAAGHSDAGLPTGTLTQRGSDLQSADRLRGHGPTGARRTHGDPGPSAGGAASLRVAAARAAPEGTARRALERAGRLSAPTTAPPPLS